MRIAFNSLPILFTSSGLTGWKKAVKEAMNQLKRIVVKCKPEKMNADLAHQLDELRINLENVLNN